MPEPVLAARLLSDWHPATLQAEVLADFLEEATSLRADWMEADAPV